MSHQRLYRFLFPLHSMDNLVSPLRAAHIPYFPDCCQHTSIHCPINVLNPGQSIPRNRASVWELAAASILCFLPLYYISTGTTGYQWTSPMYTLNIHPQMPLPKTLWETGTVDSGIAFTPLYSFVNTGCLSWIRGRCLRPGDLHHLAILHERALISLLQPSHKSYLAAMMPMLKILINHT